LRQSHPRGRQLPLQEQHGVGLDLAFVCKGDPLGLTEQAARAAMRNKRARAMLERA
jgi:hypothetical protein